MRVGPVLLVWVLTAISTGGLGLDVAGRDPVLSEGVAALPSTDFGFRPPQPLPFFHDLYTFRGDGGRTTVVAAFAVEAGELENESVGDNNRYRFNITLILADTALRSLTNRHDSVFVDLPRRVRGEHLLCAHIEVRVPPSRNIRQGVFMNDAKVGSGQMYWEDIQIPDYSGTELMLSDVALGQPGAQSGWERGGATLALLPTHRLPSRAFDVYYEIYNLPTGNPYTTEITVERVAGGSGETAQDREPVHLRFSGESKSAAGGTLPELRNVITPFSKGRYRITVTIEDQVTGKTASRSRTFEVQTSGQGATMVPAVQVAPWGQGPG